MYSRSGTGRRWVKVYFRVQILAIAGSVLMVFLIFELIRKKRLLEQYSLLWLGSAVVLFILSIWRDLLEKIAALMGVYYAPSALFIIALFCGIVLFLHFSIIISKLTKQNIILAQELALLREELRSHSQYPATEALRPVPGPSGPTRGWVGVGEPR